MVRLSKIYTKTGDDGTTALGDGTRVPKPDLRVEAYGSVDEANASIGVCVLHATSQEVRQARIRPLLLTIQNDLFDVGADLCVPIDPEKPEAPGSRLRVTPQQVAALEQAIDFFNEKLRPLDSFVLPGGSALAAHLHVARTVVRRAERVCVELAMAEDNRTNPQVVIYLNRLSDLLFVLARVANNDGTGDVKWVPGGKRGT